MGFSTKKGKGVISEINVTPLVDVMLVLLVIFMITAPLMLNGIKLTLPKTKESNPINLQSSQIVVSLTKANEIFLGKEPVSKEQLPGKVMDHFKKHNTETLFLRADFSINYGKVASLMSFLKRNGVSQIALVTEIKKEK